MIKNKEDLKTQLTLRASELACNLRDFAKNRDNDFRKFSFNYNGGKGNWDSISFTGRGELEFKFKGATISFRNLRPKGDIGDIILSPLKCGGNRKELAKEYKEFKNDLDTPITVTEHTENGESISKTIDIGVEIVNSLTIHLGYDTGTFNASVEYGLQITNSFNKSTTKEVSKNKTTDFTFEVPANSKVTLTNDTYNSTFDRDITVTGDLDYDIYIKSKGEFVYEMFGRDNIEDYFKGIAHVVHKDYERDKSHMENLWKENELYRRRTQYIAKPLMTQTTKNIKFDKVFSKLIEIKKEAL